MKLQYPSVNPGGARRATRVLVAAVLAVAVPVQALAFQLITAQEASALTTRNANAPTEGLPLGSANEPLPVIRIKRPDVSSPLRSPVDIDVEFEAREGAEILPTTFKARMGWIDLTSRIREHAAIDRGGLHIRNAELPRGVFSLVLEVADSLKRVGRVELKLTIQ